MTVFKCKMCGGTIEFEQGATVGVCDSCGTKQTLPRLDDDRRANLYDRANHFRRNNEFDKAAGVYEQILDEDGTDAEAYWSLVLCRYGIEYVEDPATHKRVPTVNRAQFTSIFDDDNYKSALQYADGSQRAIYEEEAAVINEIQKGILAISQKEDPFDVFICYKETDQNGRRTQDSVLANDLYHQLTQEGFKVFFSRITLEDKLGTAYEPYIFAALNSSKVMVVLGTKPEYFNAVWVKNEWSRYLSLVKKGNGKKILIPAYRDMDPYDLPEEFSHLQAQDLGKLGFMQDLIRGIKKIVDVDCSKEAVGVSSGKTDASALIRRGNIALDDHEWSDAITFFEQALNTDPENSEGYLGLLLAKVETPNLSILADSLISIKDMSEYKKAIRFAPEEIRKRLEVTASQIEDHIQAEHNETLYQSAIAKMDSDSTGKTFREAAAVFSSLGEYKDSSQKASECLEKAEKIERARKKRTSRAIGVTGGLVAAVLIGVGIFYYITKIHIPSSKYNSAISLMDKENYDEAIAVFSDLGDYQDSSAKIEECNNAKTEKAYKEALLLMEQGNYESAIEAFEILDGYGQSVSKIEECNSLIRDSQYQAVVALIEKGDYRQALEDLAEYSDYPDYEDNILKCHSGILKAAEIGDIVYLGHYPDSEKTMEWYVIDKNGDELLLFNKYVVGADYFGAVSRDNGNRYVKRIDWKDSKIRSYLNGQFYDTCFLDAEKGIIVSTSWNNNTTDTISNFVTKEKDNFAGYDISSYYFYDAPVTDDYIVSPNYDEFIDLIADKAWELANLFNSVIDSPMPYWLRDTTFKHDYENTEGLGSNGFFDPGYTWSGYEGFTSFLNPYKTDFSGGDHFSSIRPMMWVDTAGIE